MKCKILCGIILILTITSNAADLPKWVDLKADQELIQAQATAQGRSGEIKLKNSGSSVVKIDRGECTLVKTQYEGSLGKSAWAYNLLSFYGPSPERNLIYQVIDEAGCKLVNGITLKKLGAIENSSLYWAVFKFEASTCVGSKTRESLRSSLIFQDNGKVKKVYESPIDQKNYIPRLIGGLIFIDSSTTKSKMPLFSWNSATKEFSPMEH